MLSFSVHFRIDQILWKNKSSHDLQITAVGLLINPLLSVLLQQYWRTNGCIWQHIDAVTVWTVSITTWRMTGDIRSYSN